MSEIYISIVAPVYNEEDGIDNFYAEISKVLKKINKKYEILFIDDGSRDSSLEKIAAIAGKDKNAKVISFSRNFGHQVAITAGMDLSSGGVVVTIDTDLQDDPNLILEMIEQWHKGYDVVYAKRRTRKDTAFKKFSAAVYYRLLSKLADTDIPLDTGDYRLMDRKVVNSLKKIREHSRFVRGLVTWVGFKQTAVEFDRGDRKTGTTNYPVKKMVKLAVDGLVSFSYKPLKMATWLGFVVTTIGIVLSIYFILLKIIEPTRIVEGWTTIVLLMLVIGGVQLFIMGIIGEYIGRIYTEGQKRPLYLIRESINFESSLIDD